MSDIDVDLYEFPIIGETLLKLGFGIEDRSEFYFQMGSFIDSGQSIHEAIQIINDETKSVKSMKIMSIVTSRIIEAFNAGGQLTDGLKGLVPDQELFILIAGEEGSIENRTTSFIYAAEQAKKSGLLKSIVLQGLTTPVIYLIVAAGILLFCADTLLPKLEDSKPLDEWSSSAISFRDMAYFVKEDSVYYLGGLAAIIYLFIYSLPLWVGEQREFVDNYFPYSIYRDLNCSATLIALSGLVNSGKKFNESIGSIKDNGTAYLSHYMEKVFELMRTGRSSGEALQHSGFFDEKIAVQIAVFQKAGDIDSTLPRMSEASFTIVTKKIKKFSRISNIIGLAFVGYIVVSMLEAVMSFGNSSPGL